MASETRRVFTAEYKMEVARQLLDGHRTVSELSRELDIHENTLYKWRRKYETRGSLAFPGNGHRAEPVGEKETLEREIERLRRELDRAQMERDILKKAVGIFTHHSR